jgi:hypothetical protein
VHVAAGGSRRLRLFRLLKSVFSQFARGPGGSHRCTDPAPSATPGVVMRMRLRHKDCAGICGMDDLLDDRGYCCWPSCSIFLTPAEPAPPSPGAAEERARNFIKISAIRPLATTLLRQLLRHSGLGFQAPAHHRAACRTTKVLKLPGTRPSTPPSRRIPQARASGPFAVGAVKMRVQTRMTKWLAV